MEAMDHLVGTDLPFFKIVMFHRHVSLPGGTLTSISILTIITIYIFHQTSPSNGWFNQFNPKIPGSEKPGLAILVT
jgi:hypothetical protein